ncbi:MAG TPA: hypothetical protein VM935_12450 [Chitinophagaceae bacterium]|jgi:hypothetical protein|nr:hypothetical protein [Chitinophagaceae bacterium]
MKYLFLCLLLSPALANAQACQLKKTKDQFSQEPKISTGFISFNNSLLSIDANKKEIDFFFSLKNSNDTKCFDDASVATFVFEGKLKSNFKNTGTMNCEGLFHINFKNLATTPGVLNRLLTKKITAISLTGNNKSVTTITLGAEQQQQLMDWANCLVTEAKTLL